MMGFFKRREEKKRQAEERKKAQEAEKVFHEGVATIRDLIAPASLEVTPTYIKLGETFVRTLFVFTYPRYLYTEWLSPIINMDITLDVSMFIHPVESKEVLRKLKVKSGQIESMYKEDQKKGAARDIALETAYQDVEELREKLQKGESRFFQFALYFTIYANSAKELENSTKEMENVLNSQLIYTKPANLQQEQGLNSSLPLNNDQLHITRNMDTGALSSCFPFLSSELSSNDGILYGINRHNNGLIMFDRFNLENANSVVLAKAGSGKSYAVKLEALRSLILDTEIIIIDPENEYKTLCDSIDGAYLNVSLTSREQINPFDLPQVENPEEGEGALKSNIIMLHGLMNIMLGKLTAQEDNILDKALIETYTAAGITSDINTHKNTPPTLGDLQKNLANAPEGTELASRLKKYTSGTFAGTFNQQSNININNKFIVFAIRDLEEELRPIGMYIVLNFIWNRIKSKLKKRILIVDEAWYLMKYEDSAQFLFSIAKRARKYYLGLTTISQDVEDFLRSPYGRAIITNSSLSLLLKQHPAAVDLVTKAFHLTDAEKYMLLNCEVGEGLFFAGLNHVAIQIMASYTEDQLITTNPQELVERKGG